LKKKNAKYLKEIETLVDKHDIPPQLIINWDYTAMRENQKKRKCVEETRDKASKLQKLDLDKEKLEKFTKLKRYGMT